jgi:hypothetical protein
MTDCCGPSTLNLCIYQGETYTRIFTWLISTCGCPTVGASPSVVDLTGFTATMQIRAFPLSSTVLYDATTDLTLGGTAGTITLTIPSANTETFTWWTGVYDLLLISSGGIVTPFLQGTVTVMPGVSTP